MLGSAGEPPAPAGWDAAPSPTACPLPHLGAAGTAPNEQQEMHPKQGGGAAAAQM